MEKAVEHVPAEEGEVTKETKEKAEREEEIPGAREYSESQVR
jgi:hypothetical protein